MDIRLHCSDQAQLITHWVPFAQRPSFFVPGLFSAVEVGGVYRFGLVSPALVLDTQVRILWFAPHQVIEPFVPGVAVAVILDHPELEVWVEALATEHLQQAGRSLIQSGAEDFYDRFTLPS